MLMLLKSGLSSWSHLYRPQILRLLSSRRGSGRWKPLLQHGRLMLLLQHSKPSFKLPQLPLTLAAPSGLALILHLLQVARIRPMLVLGGRTAHLLSLMLLPIPRTCSLVRASRTLRGWLGSLTSTPGRTSLLGEMTSQSGSCRQVFLCRSCWRSGPIMPSCVQLAG